MFSTVGNRVKMNDARRVLKCANPQSLAYNTSTFHKQFFIPCLNAYVSKLANDILLKKLSLLCFKSPAATQFISLSSPLVFQPFSLNVKVNLVHFTLLNKSEVKSLLKVKI